MIPKIRVWVLVLFMLLFTACGGGSGGKVTKTYPVSSRIVYENANGKPAANVVITLTGADQAEVVTDSQGRWAASFKGTGTATPVKEGFQFEPASQTFSSASSSADFIAKCTLPAYTVSGTVKDQYGAKIAGVTIAFESEILDYEAVTTDDQGSWSKSGFKGSVRIIPSYQDHTFDPAYEDVTGAESDIDFTMTAAGFTVSGIIADEDGQPIPNITVNYTTLSDLAGLVATDSTGRWTIANLTEGVTITPSSDEFRFEPLNHIAGSGGSGFNFTAKTSSKVAPVPKPIPIRLPLRRSSTT